MKRVFFLTPLALAAMAGCAPAPNEIQNGQWEIVSETRSFDVPGATPEQQRQASRQIGRPDTLPQCFSREQARTLVQDFRRGPANCRVSDETYANGVMRTRVTCPGPGGQQASLSLDGTFTNTTFNLTITEEGPNPTGASREPLRRTVRLRGRRTGDCTPTPTPALPAQPSEL